MAKIYGLFGSMQGKVADVVMAVRNGEQIVRKYQPIVSNPKSAAQVAVRAKLKAMSQLSAVLAPEIAIARQGAISSRNLFVKMNFGQANYINDEATIDLLSVQLTKSVVAFPGITANREGQTSIRVLLNRSISDVDSVVYVALIQTSDNKLRLGGSTVVTSSDDGTYAGSIATNTNEPCIVYAYGVRNNTEAAKAYFGNLESVSAETIAKVVVTRTLLERDITLTETRAISVPIASSQSVAPTTSDENRSVTKKTNAR